MPLLKRTNDSIRKQLGNIPENWLLDTILRRKLAYFGHIKRHDCLEKQIFEGIVEGKRGRGRPKRRWSQDVSDRLHTTVAEAGRRALSRDAFRRAAETLRAAEHLLHAEEEPLLHICLFNLPGGERNKI